VRAAERGLDTVRPDSWKGEAQVCAVADGESEELEGEEEEESTTEKRKPAKMVDPIKPSASEVEEHELTHLPFRNWCWACVQGRGKNAAHRRSTEEKKIPEVHLDFMFMGPKDQPGETVPCLVVREAITKMTMAAAVPNKSAERFVIRRVLAFLTEVGCMHKDVIVKSDQEPSIASIVNEIGKMRAMEGGGRWIVESSPVGASASNGVVERAIQSVQAQTRVLKLALEKRWGVDIPVRHAAIPWAVEYSAFLLNRYEVGHDGRTAYERLKGKRAKCLGLEFGETVHWRTSPTSGALGKLSSSWRQGVYLGVRGKSGEIIVADDQGVWKTRTVQRRPKDERWSASSADLVTRYPWSKEEQKEGSQGGPVAVKMKEDEVDEEKKFESREPVPRNFYIRAEDLKEHGFSAGCQGCLSILRGTTRQGHSRACRKRFEEILKGSEKVKRAHDKISEYLAKMIEKDVEERKAKKAKMTDEQDEEMKDSEAQGGRQEEGSSGPQRREESSGTGASTSSGSGLTDEDRRGVRTSSGEAAHPQDDEPKVKKPRVESDESHMLSAVGIMELHSEENEDSEMEVYDERSGEVLDPELVKKSRMEELGFMKKIDLYEEAPIEECWERTGKPPVDTKWVDLNKGTKEKPDVRCRMVARDFKPKGEKDREDLFAAMPPLEAKKLMFKKAAMGRHEWRNGRWARQKLMFIDVKKAHLNGVVGEDECAYVSVPTGVCPPGKCWRLKRWLYGMRPAASAWESDYSEKLGEFGMKKGRAVPTAFFDESRNMRCVVHGDDFTFLGWEEDLEDVEKYLEKFYELKVRGVLGGEPGDMESIVILNRRLTWKGNVMRYEADERHAEMICKGVGLESSSKGLDRPSVKETIEEVMNEERECPLSPEETREFRALAARANYLAMDRPDIQFSVKEVCRDMAAPSKGSWLKLKRVARYLLEFPRLEWRFGGEDEENVDLETLHVFSDSDWGGCLRTRKSTSGGVVVLGGVALKHWSSTQSTIALSSGEAEYTALVKAAAEGLGVQALAADLGWTLRLVVHVDSATAKSIASRSGVGKVRHLETKALWVQEAVKGGRFGLAKVRGTSNPADPLTKPQGYSDFVEIFSEVGAMPIRRKVARSS